MATFLLIVIAIEAYLLGGINGSIIVSKYLYHKDVRDFGSGNAGLTNFYRTFGAFGLVLVILVDVLKSVIALLIAKGLMSIVDAPQVGVQFGGFCLMLGHIYPVFYGFKGGKGVLCACVVTFLARWWIGVICLAVFAVVLIFTRFVSLGSMSAAVVYAPLCWIAGLGGLEGFLGLLCALLLIFAHRSNIVRLLNHKETKFAINRQSPKRNPQA
jgi:glycerol-3-phosphate acyltransferase PlsY